MALIRPKDLDTKSTLASTDEVMLDGDTTGSMPRDTFIAQVAALIVASPSTYKLATLDGADKLTSSQDPSQAVSYIGTHDVSSNTPTLIDGTGTAGDTYQVNVAGTRDYGSGSLTLAVGDALVYSGTVWQQVSGVANILDGISTPAAAQTALEVVSRDEYSRGIGTKLVGPAISFDGTNDYIEIADSDKFTFSDGTDDTPFSVSLWVKADDWTTFAAINKYGTSAANQEWAVRTSGGDTLNFQTSDTSGNVATLASDAALTAYEGQWIHLCITYPGAGPNSANAFTANMDGAIAYLNGSVLATTASNNASYGGMSNTSQAVWIGRWASSYGDGDMKDVKVFNRELSATEVTTLYNEGQLGLEDQWAGGHGDTYTSDFSAGDDGFSSNAGTDAGNIDSIGGEDDNLRFTLNSSADQHFLFKTVSGIEVGKRYALSFDFYIDNSNSNADGLQVSDGSAGSLNVYTSPTLNTWTRGQLDYVATGTQIRFYALDGGVISFQDAGGDDVFYIRNVTVTQIGTLADFRAENFNEASGKLIDLSDNGFIGANNGASVVGGKKHVQASSLDLTGIPTSSAGLSAGEVYSNSGVLTIV